MSVLITAQPFVVQRAGPGSDDIPAVPLYDLKGLFPAKRMHFSYVKPIIERFPDIFVCMYQHKHPVRPPRPTSCLLASCLNSPKTTIPHLLSHSGPSQHMLRRCISGANAPFVKNFVLLGDASAIKAIASQTPFLHTIIDIVDPELCTKLRKTLYLYQI
jgi:hypothetical protein